MIIIDIIIFMIVAFAITDILTVEDIFEWLRVLIPYKPFTCSKCMSVWVGFILSFIFPPLYSVWISWFIYGMISFTFNRFCLLIIDNRL